MATERKIAVARPRSGRYECAARASSTSSTEPRAMRGSYGTVDLAKAPSQAYSRLRPHPMKIENAFEVEASPESAWGLLMDVPRVIPCMPGAELTETIDDSTWKAHLKVKLGPIALNFEADVTREEVDEAARRVRLAAQARELKGRGAALATIESSLAAVNGGTRVEVVTDLGMSGAIAQYGRGMIQDVSTQLVSSFADCLQRQLVDGPEQAQAAVAEQAKPVSGLSLFFRALGRTVTRPFRRRSQ